MKIHLAIVVIAALLAAAACFAQDSSSLGTLPLPEGITSLAAIDAHNAILVGAETEEKKRLHYELVYTKHIYAGGIARLFGGTAVPTLLMVTPGFSGAGGFFQTSGGAINPRGMSGEAFSGGQVPAAIPSQPNSRPASILSQIKP